MKKKEEMVAVKANSNQLWWWSREPCQGDSESYGQHWIIYNFPSNYNNNCLVFVLFLWDI